MPKLNFRLLLASALTFGSDLWCFHEPVILFILATDFLILASLFLVYYKQWLAAVFVTITFGLIHGVFGLLIFCALAPSCIAAVLAKRDRFSAFENEEDSETKHIDVVVTGGKTETDTALDNTEEEDTVWIEAPPQIYTTSATAVAAIATSINVTAPTPKK
jgi:hypothetical protein